MVDSTKACESDYISVDLVQNCKSKIGVIVGPGEYKMGKFGEQLRINIQIDGKMKYWTLNKESAVNLNKAFGKDTEAWVGKKVLLELKQNKTGTTSIVGAPYMESNTPEVLNSDMAGNL